MNSTTVSLFRRVGAVRALVTVFLVCAVSSALMAQDDQNRRRDGQDNGGRNFNPADMQARLLTALRDRLGITNDEEWTVISDRVMKVMEIRRTATPGGGGFAFRGGTSGGGADRGGRSMRGGGSPEADALQAAITDKLPDAEIKARLDKLRETRKANEAKLAQAQEDLRAVLNVRQEATAVMMGLLP